MTFYISSLRNLKFFAALAVAAHSLNFASRLLSRLFWLLAGEAASLLGGAFLAAWRSAPPQIFSLYHLVGCPFEALALLRSVFQALSGAL